MWGVLAGFFGSLLQSSVARFIALKIVLTTLFLTVLPLVLKYVIVWMLDGSMSVLSSVLPSSVQSFTIQLTGLASYMGNLLRLPDAVSIVISALALRFTLSSLKIIL